MRLLAIDLETTGLDPAKDQIIEVGAVLWDTDRSTALQVYSAFVFGPVVSAEITAITGITQTDLEEFGQTIASIETRLMAMAEKASYLVGHNAREFDRSFIVRVAPWLGEYHWLDTMTDLPGVGPRCRKLTHLAAEHGFLNPFPHRALFDALASIKILSAYPLNEVIRYATAPVVRLEARGLPFDRKDEAKAAGFHWDSQRRVWFKVVKEFQRAEVLAAITFPVTEVAA